MSRDGDIVDYLLGELPAGRREALERRMREDEAFRREVDRMRPVVDELSALPADAWDATTVPPLPDLPPLPATEPPARARWSLPAWRPLVAVAASVVLIGVGVAIGLVVADGGGDDEGPPIALAAIGEGGAGASGRARVVSADDGGLRVSVSGLEPSAADGFYELWLLDGPERLISLGGFRVPASGAAEVTVPLPVEVNDFAYVDVSVEREDGDPGHSGVSVLRGPTAPA